MFCSLLTRCTIPCACHAKPHLNVQKCSVPLSVLHFWLRNVLRATTACTFSTSQLPKVVRAWCVLYILTSKCASRHNGVHFFDISTSKSGPSMVCFVHFDFEMCFAPQRRALFRHLNFQKWSETVSFLHFWLRNVLRAKTACNFSSLIWPAGSAPAALASLLFDPPQPQQCFGTFLPFRAPGSSFFWDFLFFDLLFSSLLLSDSSHLCFSSVHIVGSLTSKLPWINDLTDFDSIEYCIDIIWQQKVNNREDASGQWLCHLPWHQAQQWQLSVDERRGPTSTSACCYWWPAELRYEPRLISRGPRVHLWEGYGKVTASSNMDDCSKMFSPICTRHTDLFKFPLCQFDDWRW